MSTNSMNALIDYAVTGADRQRTGAREWRPEEEIFLKRNLGRLTDTEIGKALGRTAVAVHLRWDRDMQLPSPSKAPNVVTAHEAARMLGIDTHKICHWVDQGFIPGRLMAGGRKIRLIEREDFRKWVLDPQHWMYFDLNEVTDAELKKLLKDAAKAWGDEWWSTPKVAKYHGVNAKDVLRYIQHGRIQGIQIKYSYGGRHPNLSWKYWFILKSEATRPDLRFVTTKPGKGNKSKRTRSA